MIPPTGGNISLTYKLEFDTTTNVVEYEALILGLKVEKKMKITKLVPFGVSKLVVQHVRSAYQTKHSRMRYYRNQVWDIVENLFHVFKITTIPREGNQHANYLQ